MLATPSARRRSTSARLSVAPTPQLRSCHIETENEESLTVTFDGDMTLTTTSLLGVGGFGRVYVAKSPSGESYALKVSFKDMSESDWGRLKEEVRHMALFSHHPNVVKLYASGRDERRAYVAMERCVSKSLHDIVGMREMSLDEILWVGWSLVDTLKFMHGRGCIHRDIKPQNLLFDFDGNLKITDFGLSSRITENNPRSTVAGTAMYMAPSLAERAMSIHNKTARQQGSFTYGLEVDAWSVGIVLFVLATRRNPYTKHMERVTTQDKKARQAEIFRAAANASWDWPENFHGDADFVDLVERILARNPEDRLNIDEIHEHPIWERRPYSCPLSLLTAMGLVDTGASPRRSSMRASLGAVPINTPAPKKSLDAYMAEATHRLETAEDRERNRLYMEQVEYHRILSYINVTLVSNHWKGREEIMRQQYVAFDKLKMQFTRATKAVGRRSMSLASGTDSMAASKASPRGVSGSRQPSKRGGSMELTSNASEEGVLVSEDKKVGVLYPGRSSSTRWSLREVVSVPRDMVVDTLGPQAISPGVPEEDHRCMNKHKMTKMTSIPAGYLGYDCNVCEKEINELSKDKPMYRCHKCDYDVCLECTLAKKEKSVTFRCVTCGKKFPTNDKLTKHALACRGPSMSPSPRRSTHRDTLVFGNASRPSALDVNLPGPKNAAPASAKKTTSRQTSRGRSASPGSRSSGSGRLSLGPAVKPQMYLDNVNELAPQVPARVSTVSTASGGSDEGTARASRSSRQRLSEGRFSSAAFELPPENPKRAREEPQEKLIDESPNRHSARRKSDPIVATMEAAAEKAPTPSKPRASPGRQPGGPGGSRSRSQAAQGMVTITAQPAEPMAEMGKAPRLSGKSQPRQAESSQQRAGPGQQQVLTTGRMPTPVRASPAVFTLPTPSMPIATASRSMPQQQTNFPVPGTTSVGQGVVASGPRPRTGSRPSVVPAPPPLGAPSMPAQFDTGVSVSRGPSAAGVARSSGGGAFLAMPQNSHDRHRYTEEFLSGAWVRWYSFCQDDVILMHYTLQPGRYGALFPVEGGGTGTAVIDVNSRMVLYAPSVSQDSVQRREPHPHVQTSYDEDVRIISLDEARRAYSALVDSILQYVHDFTQARAAGHNPRAQPAGYIHHQAMSSVPRDTKFAYVRKVFPDPAGAFTLFRLSNMRSQVVCNTARLDIRWQSDGKKHVGMKYHVHGDGRCEPFSHDTTGVLQRVEQVLENSYRNR